MDLEDAITVTKIEIQGVPCHLMISWKVDTFEVFLFLKDKLWKGRFSQNRLLGFSKNLHMSTTEYFSNVKKCLSHGRSNYLYELKGGFFYWKRRLQGSLVIEGFMPMELDRSPKHARPNLIKILTAMNKHMKQKVHTLEYRFQVIKTEYQRCLKDTEEFLSLKIQMEKTLCEKFLSLLSVKRSRLGFVNSKQKNKNNNERETGVW
ncbi:hypothetical protein PYW08_007482 [Mythimna loreyi]|uniref:Uncharacterized protein n=1 Tax=Mythimna loreyi TaxID=667449 RepID=A0ACC2QGX3_9NEOP|nr:hypothetical protein PYW08_007482 [Mythimna loreyi]